MPKSTELENNITKEASKVTEEKRDGGQLFTPIIPIENRERDENGLVKELIQELKDGSLTKTIYYKPDGSVDVDCTEDEIWVRIEEKLNERDLSIKTTEEKIKDKEKTEEFDSSVILYAFIGLGFIILVGCIVFSRILLKHTSTVGKVLDRL